MDNDYFDAKKYGLQGPKRSQFEQCCDPKAQIMNQIK